MSESKRFLVAGELALRLGVSRRTIFRWNALGTLARSDLGGIPFYDWARIEARLAGRCQPNLKKARRCRAAGRRRKEKKDQHI